MHVLSAADKERFARHLLLAEIGVAGQARLCEATVSLPAECDARAAEVARMYLERAGVHVASEAGPDADPVALGTHEAIAALAGDPALHEAAAWLAGSFASVEAIKRVLGAGQPGTFDSSLVLAPEKR